MDMRTAFVTCLVLVGSAAGCSSDPSCEKAISHAMDVMASAKGDDSRSDGASAEENKERREKALQMCTEEKWSAETRTCLVKTKSPDDLEPCLKGKGQKKEAKRDSRVTEPKLNLSKLSSGARAYYHEMATFPAGDTGVTPAVGSCCSGGGGGKCAPDPKLWDTPLWNTLNFSMDDPHYYSYQYIGAGTGRDASFTVRALGDLDCDGELSTFEMVGKVDAEGNVSGSAGLFIDKELE